MDPELIQKVNMNAKLMCYPNLALETKWLKVTYTLSEVSEWKQKKNQSKEARGREQICICIYLKWLGNSDTVEDIHWGIQILGSLILTG